MTQIMAQSPDSLAGSPVATQSADFANLRGDFPALQQEVNGKPLVYLDSAATALKPQSVIDATVRMLTHDVANVHRAVHTLSQRATLAYEGVREKVAAFLNAETEEVVYQHGTTEAMNLLAFGLGRKRVKAGDEVLITGLEHHASIVPWQRVVDEAGATLRVVPVADDGALSLEDVRGAMSDKTRVVVMSHVSNTLGVILPVSKVAELARERGALLFLDGAQAVAHVPVDVNALGCDAYAFSAHKLYGPPGAGALWARKGLLEEMDPLLLGGDMIDTVRFEGSTFADPPHRFEAGTPPIASVVGMGAAIDYVQSVTMNAIRAHDEALVEAGYEALSSVPGLQLLGWPSRATFEASRGEVMAELRSTRVPVFAFVVEGAHPADLGSLVDLEGVAIRTGHHCAMPLMATLGVTGSARASAGLYNTAEDFHVLVKAIEKARRMLGQAGPR